jgi:hypothetical protein
MADASLAELPLQVALALSLASSTTGADYDYLVKTAQRESSFQADAKAASSSATGLFQFIEETWIRTIKEEGEQYGLGDYAKLIVKTDSGRYEVPNPRDREAILALRSDPQISAMMAGAYAQRNERHLAAEIGREPTAGELYIAHFLGAIDAVRLIQVRDMQQQLSAPDLFPRAAAANKAIFYRDGEPRSVGEVYDLLIKRHDRARRVRPAGAEASEGTVVGSWEATMPTVYSRSELFPLYGNFSFPGNRRSGDGPVKVATIRAGDAPEGDPLDWAAEIAGADVSPAAKAVKAKPAAKPVDIASVTAESTNAVFGLRGSLDDGAAFAGAVESAPAALLKIVKVSSN